MNDAERQAVGTCYKQQGQQAAIELGHRLVAGDLKAERIAAWAQFAQAHPDGLLYCFRGGLRSQIVQEWLETEAGIVYPRVIGGYKAMRGFLIETLEHDVTHARFVVLGRLDGLGQDRAAEPAAAQRGPGGARQPPGLGLWQSPHRAAGANRFREHAGD